MQHKTKPVLTVSLDELDRDPYTIFERVRSMGGIVWIEPLSLWYVVGYQNIRTILLDDVNFTTGTQHSLLFDTFGGHMLTQNGDAHLRARIPFHGAFSPGAIRVSMAHCVAQIVNELIDGFPAQGTVDLKTHFAARLPVLAMLQLFGFDRAQEANLRVWYDHFERALANFMWDDQIRADAKAAMADFSSLISAQIQHVRTHPGQNLLSKCVHDTSLQALSEDEIIANAAIIFFGGISTVEALLLNTLYASALHGFDLKGRDATEIATAIDETMRWLSPVQSATRHVTAPTRIGAIDFRPGDTVNCMLGGANRDPEAFDRPNLWRTDRSDDGRHLGFAAGPHFCLGSHLAKLEVQIAISLLKERLGDWTIMAPNTVEVRGFEFRQPKQLWLSSPQKAL